jgi:tetraacyldisaccharide 4'-kinase
MSTVHRTPHTAYRTLLSPFSFLFGMVAFFRRKAFQKGWLRSETFNVPTVCVGNLRVGGTGKTPLVEYIADFLSQNHQIAILSRGYRRKTKGYIHASEAQNLSSNIIGDEPMQYVTKFPNVEVAVCEKRKIGIQKLLEKNPNLEMVILDDAYQHLSVNYSLKIVLTEYRRPFFKDFPIPSGNLREFRSASKHADIIIITKCPENLSSEEKEDFIKNLKPQSEQELFFTKLQVTSYKLQVASKCSNSKLNFELNSGQQSKILLITGIENPAPLVHHLENEFGAIHKLHFPDHHSFTKKDIEKIIRLKEQLGGKDCTVITTEKDAVRLQAFDNMPEFYVAPIEIVFLDKVTLFKEKLLSLLHQKHA